MSAVDILATFRTRARSMLIAECRERLDTDPTARPFLRSALENDYRDELGLTAGEALDEHDECIFVMTHGEVL